MDTSDGERTSGEECYSYLAHSPAFLNPLPEFSFILKSGLVSETLETFRCFQALSPHSERISQEDT